MRSLSLVALVALPALAGDAKLVSFELVARTTGLPDVEESPTTATPEALRKALEAEVLPRLLRCVPEDARRDAQEERFEVAVLRDGGLMRLEGLYGSGLDGPCESAALKSFPERLGPARVAFTVRLKTSAAERAGAKAAHLRELTRFCGQVAKLRGKHGGDAALYAAQALLADKTLSGRSLVLFNLLAQASPADHPALVQASAKSAGGAVQCPALK